MRTKLIDQIIQIASKYNPILPDSEFEKVWIEKLHKYNLQNDSNVPPWIFDLLQAIIDERNTGRVTYPFEREDEVDWLNFLGQFPETISLEEHDFGEDTVWILNKKLQVVISFESDFYEVRKI